MAILAKARVAIGLTVLMGIGAPATAGSIIVSSVPGGPFADASGNTITVSNSAFASVDFDLIKLVVANETIAAGFTSGALNGATAGVLRLVEGVTNNTSAAWSSLLLTTLAPSGGGAGFLSSAFAMTQPGAIQLGPEVNPGVATLALLQFSEAVLPGQSFLFSFALLFDVTGAPPLPSDAVVVALTETPGTVPEPASLVLALSGIAMALGRRRLHGRHLRR